MLDPRIYGARHAVIQRGLGAPGDETPTGYVYDSITGMPIADPSGSLQSSGYETKTADAALAIGNEAAAAVKTGIGYLFSGLKILVVGAVIVAGIVVVAETKKALR